MFSHKQVWSAIDALARQQNMSVSRLAREAGLDPTTFNKSKRVAADGRLRWPSTESLAKIMQATNSSVENFTRLINQNGQEFARQYATLDSTLAGAGMTDQPQSAYTPPRSIPLLGLAQAGSGGFFDDAGLPAGEGWEAIDFPGIGRELVYALEISGDSMLPLYRDGDRIIVSTASSIRRGDRVVVRTREGEVLAKELARQTADSVELKSVNPDFDNRTINLQDIEWMARILWASQ